MQLQLVDARNAEDDAVLAFDNALGLGGTSPHYQLVDVLNRIRLAEATLAASRAELESSEKRYEAGLAEIVELETAQRNYTADDAAYTNARYGFFLSKAAVEQATGRSLAGS